MKMPARAAHEIAAWCTHEQAFEARRLIGLGEPQAAACALRKVAEQAEDLANSLTTTEREETA